MAASVTAPWWSGFVVAAFVAMAAWWRDKRKGDIDESALVLGKWKELVDQHQTDIKGIREEFASYKSTAIAEIADLRKRVMEAETGLVSANRRITELETENAGLRRAIAQNSQSTAYQLGRVATRSTGIEDAVARLDRAGHNSGPSK